MLLKHKCGENKLVFKKKTKNVFNSDIFLITRSSVLSKDDFITGEEIREMSQYAVGIVALIICCFIIKDKFISFSHEYNNKNQMFIFSQSKSDFPKTTMGKNSCKNLPLKKSLNDLENVLNDIAGFYKSYDELKYLHREAWKMMFLSVYSLIDLGRKVR